MRTDKRTIILASVMLLIGLLAGWLLFSGEEQDPTHKHDHAADAGVASIWTCSMHPQIRQSDPGDCPICGMDLIPLEDEVMEDSNPLSIRMSATAMQLANVQTTVVQATEPVKSIRLTGKVQPDERRVVSQSSHIPGRIEKLGVNFTGEYVQSGQTIASIYSPQLITAQEELFEAARMSASNPQIFNAAREKLKSWRITDQQINRMLETGQTTGIFDVASDVSGYVTAKLVNQGDYIERGQIIYEISDLSRIWILLDVYEQDLVWINRGDKVQLTAQSLPGETFEGTINWVSPVINPQTRVAQARVEIGNRELKLKPGMFVTAHTESPVSATTESVVVPKSAVMWTGKRSLVYVKNTSAQDVAFNMREVILGPSLGDRYLIESGLEEGEEIAVSGTFSIDAAAQLSGKPSMMMPTETKTFDVPVQFRNQITHFTHQYFDLKNALVNDDPEAAAETAIKVSGALSQVDMALLESSAHDHWMMILKPMQESTEQISGTTEIEEQRVHFKTLSDHIIEMTESFGLEIKSVYRQYCPMAFDDTGAHWLSESDEVLNPYYGDMMLHCGEVQETYRQGQRIIKQATKQDAPDTHGHHH